MKGRKGYGRFFGVPGNEVSEEFAYYRSTVEQPVPILNPCLRGDSQATFETWA